LRTFRVERRCDVSKKNIKRSLPSRTRRNVPAKRKQISVEPSPEGVWKKIDPLTQRFASHRLSLDEIVGYLVDYDDRSLPLREFITGLAVQLAGPADRKREKKGSRKVPKALRSERVRLTVPDIVNGLDDLIRHGNLDADDVVSRVALAWLRYEGSYVLSQQEIERLAGGSRPGAAAKGAEEPAWGELP
jgi:hypothetical protein